MVKTFTYQDGSIYSGEVNHIDLPHGQGVFKTGDGSYRYEGEFRNGLKEGYGYEYYSDGSKFQGNFVGNHRKGMGTWFSKDGTLYRGNYSNDMANGRIKVICPDGRFYEAFFVDNELEKNQYIRVFEKDNSSTRYYYDGEWTIPEKKG